MSIKAESGDGQANEMKVTVNDSLFVGYDEDDSQSRNWRLPLSRTTPPGLEAIVLDGAVSLEVNSCAFGPHRSVFHLGNGMADRGVNVRAAPCWRGSRPLFSNSMTAIPMAS